MWTADVECLLKKKYYLHHVAEMVLAKATRVVDELPTHGNRFKTCELAANYIRLTVTIRAQKVGAICHQAIRPVSWLPARFSRSKSRTSGLCVLKVLMYFSCNEKHCSRMQRPPYAFANHYYFLRVWRSQTLGDVCLDDEANVLL